MAGFGGHVKFLSRNLSVEILDNQEKLIYTIQTTDSKNPWVSYDLDQLRIESSKLVKEHDQFLASNQEKINANDPTAINKYLDISNRLKKSTLDYLSKCIIDINSHMEFLRSIRGDDMAEFQSAVQRSQFGVVDGDDKKKQITSAHTTKSNSKRMGIRKKK